MNNYHFEDEKDTFDDTELTDLALEIITDLQGTALADPEDSLFKSSGSLSNEDIPSVHSASTVSHNEDYVHRLYPTKSKYNEVLPPIKIPSAECKPTKSTQKHPYMSFTPPPTNYHDPRPKFYASSSCHIPIAEVRTIERKNVLQHVGHRVAIVPDFSDINRRHLQQTQYDHNYRRKKKRTSRRSRDKLSDRSRSSSRKKRRKPRNKSKKRRLPPVTRIVLAQSKSDNQEIYRKYNKNSIENYNEYAIETDDGFVFMQAR